MRSKDRELIIIENVCLPCAAHHFFSSGWQELSEKADWESAISGETSKSVCASSETVTSTRFQTYIFYSHHRSDCLFTRTVQTSSTTSQIGESNTFKNSSDQEVIQEESSNFEQVDPSSFTHHSPESNGEKLTCTKANRPKRKANDKHMTSHDLEDYNWIEEYEGRSDRLVKKCVYFQNKGTTVRILNSIITTIFLRIYTTVFC